ncbi:hypothetical protein [Leptospira interrogans]|uniref:Uncharacterized protein n=3 Tax=Leptospira interrogans TaxID=173 RepID=A0AAV9FWJ4_LEPIR|nr:hypothetical protein [Leptospira interrogans]EMN82513.1 hypothetical protein LEP1GSC106_0432 [Leptospira interrogans serovar Grippotyphosa str. UI 12764]KAK2617150.1 hypothetical protein CFV95_020745 [Leptospira interrogans]QOI53111.1 hypothetical protein Lepto1489_22350 [Leptospira interrogans serovar Bataviae]
MEKLDILVFDDLDPVAKYNFLCDKNLIHTSLNLSVDVKETAKLILMSLYAINKVLELEIKISGIYIGGDDSVSALLNKINIKLSNELVRESLIFLDMVKFIYRFTSALKFKIKNGTSKQLRINSWGRYFVESGLISVQNNNIYELMFSAFKSEFEVNRPLYLELVKLLKVDITNDSAKEILNINNGLNIKLLS